LAAARKRPKRLHGEDNQEVISPANVLRPLKVCPGGLALDARDCHRACSFCTKHTREVATRTVELPSKVVQQHNEARQAFACLG
jgi:hypothetical protein